VLICCEKRVWLTIWHLEDIFSILSKRPAFSIICDTKLNSNVFQGVLDHESFRLNGYVVAPPRRLNRIIDQVDQYFLDQQLIYNDLFVIMSFKATHKNVDALALRL